MERRTSAGIAVVAFILAVLVAAAAWGDEPQQAVIRYMEAGDLVCEISADLKVLGPKRDRCIGDLETAARLAKYEAKINRKRGAR